MKSVLKFLCLSFPILFQAVPAAAGERIFRCTDPDGVIVFSDTPCGRDSRSIDQPAAPKVGTRLVDPADMPRTQSEPAKSRRTVTSKSSKDREYNCRKKERRLDDVNAKLRRGYKRSEGERLRRQRVELEDYIDTYCD